MAEILGLGITHYPPLAGIDERMMGILKGTLRDPNIPAAIKDPAAVKETGKASSKDNARAGAKEAAKGGWGALAGAKAANQKEAAAKAAPSPSPKATPAKPAPPPEPEAAAAEPPPKAGSSVMS